MEADLGARVQWIASTNYPCTVARKFLEEALSSPRISHRLRVLALEPLRRTIALPNGGKICNPQELNGYTHNKNVACRPMGRNGELATRLVMKNGELVSEPVTNIGFSYSSP